MAIYVIGDIHGCYTAFRKLLKKIQFSSTDQLYLVGDLINRGAQSTNTLDFILDHQHNIHPILGNHDLSFLVYDSGFSRLKKGDTYDTISRHPNRDHYTHFLRNLPLMHYLKEYDIAVVHAGIPHFWSIQETLALTQEVVSLLSTSNEKKYLDFLEHMFGNLPDAWNIELKGYDRLRFIINALTRMRLMHTDASLDFSIKDNVYDKKSLSPWFTFDRTLHQRTKIIFGHWASLGLHHENNTYCIDSGCVWGEKLTAVRIDLPEFQFFYKKNKR